MEAIRNGGNPKWRQSEMEAIRNGGNPRTQSEPYSSRSMRKIEESFR